MVNKDLLKQVLFFLLIIFCLSPYADPPLALLAGLLLSQTLGHPFPNFNKQATKYLLQISVVGLGFGMNVFEAAKAGKEGFIFTAVIISITLMTGILLGKWMKLDKKIAYLVASGTAICGGSAIAAVSPVVEANDEEISVSLGTVFILNSIALVLFPAIGHTLNMTEHQFGMWAAIAIHDTSSVAGASAKYGQEALHIATTIKLERALWIIPLVLFTSMYYKNKKSKLQFPLFIGLFVIAMCLNTFIPQIATINTFILFIAKKGIVLTLFLIGCGLSRSALKNVGLKPILLGLALWILVSVSSLFVILNSLS